MIKDNKLVFGFGSVVVCLDDDFRTLMIMEIEPPKEVGTVFGPGNMSEQNVVAKKAVKFKFMDVKHVYELLEKVCMLHLIKRTRKADSTIEDSNSFEFHGYIFDFTNYNEGSIMILYRKLRLIADRLTNNIPKGTLRKMRKRTHGIHNDSRGVVNNANIVYIGTVEDI